MRYIDADALIKKVFPYDVVDLKCYTINAKLIYEAINKAPTADVVPESEYDALKAMLKASIAGQKTLQKALAERVEVDKVAEMFRTMFDDDCACNYNGNDEWLPFVCERQEECPMPKERLYCWKLLVKHYLKKMDGERKEQIGEE